MKLINIRDFVPNIDAKLTDIELVNKYIHMFTGVSDNVIDLRCLNFSLSISGSGSQGTLYKACTNDWYFKLSRFSEYIPEEYGYESVYEVIGSIVANWLGYENTGYEICHALISISNKEYTVYLCVSCNYKQHNEHRSTLENLLKLKGLNTLDLEENFNACKNEAYFDKLCQMILFDYIVDNRDRHGANIELLLSDTVRLSPIYDVGYCLLSPMQYDIEKFSKFSPLHDGPVNNFLISMFWQDVLVGLKGYIKVPEVDYKKLNFDYLEPCFVKHGEVILKYSRAMIIGRIKHAKEILNS